MRFGTVMFPSSYVIGPAEFAVAVEERGFDTLWFPDRTHTPTRRQSPFRGVARSPASA